MDRDDDVERLFSWIKTPDLHYREFAAEREIADAVATWPALRDAVPEPSPSDDRLEPEGPYESELLPAERARHFERPAAVFGHREPPPPAHHPVETPVPREEEPSGEVPWAAEPPPVAPYQPPPPPPVARYQPPPPPPVVVRHRPAPPPRVQERPVDQEYSGFEETRATPPPPAEPTQPGQTRSLDAILSRVAHPGSAPREGRTQPSATPGLGPVFRRLR
jgi:hypothetical protein